MLFTIYERACAMADFNNVDLAEMCRELSLPNPNSVVMVKAKNSYLTKIGLIKDKQSALDNLMGTIDHFTASNTAIIAEASTVSAKAIGMRVNLEVSVLESQLKTLEIESVSIDSMTANAFITKYGA